MVGLVHFRIFCLTMKTVAITVLLSCAAVWGHVVPNVKTGVSGKSLLTGFKISHGCDKQATTSVVFTIPDGVLNTKAQQLSGYTITTTKREVNPPGLVHGREINETVDTLTFTGDLPNEEFQFFTLSMQLPQVTEDTELKFNIVQHCVNDKKNEWIGDESSDRPAPIITVTVNDPKSKSETENTQDGAAASTTVSVFAVLISTLLLVLS